MISRLLVLISAVLLLNSCQNSTNEPKISANLCRTHLLANPKTLNPQCHTSGMEDQIVKLLFQSLLEIDLESGRLVPVLAAEMPKKEKLEGDKVAYHYRIRSQAVWDDGEPITANDVIFSFKVMMNPYCNNAIRQHYLKDIENIISDSVDVKKLTIIFSQPFIQAQWTMTDLNIIDKRLFDPSLQMDDWTISQLRAYNLSEHKQSDPGLKTFAEVFNSPVFQTDIKNLKGSGAYKITEWKTNKKVVLEVKKDWWGHLLRSNGHHFVADNDQITFNIIKDWNLTLSALEQKELDIVNSIPSIDFDRLKKDPAMRAYFNFESPTNYISEYIGFNLNHPIWSKLGARKALSYLVDRNTMVQRALKGKGTPMHSFIYPMKDYCNKSLKGEYNPEKAKIQWEKFIGKKEVRIMYNAGNKRRQTIAELLVSEIKSIGGNAVTESYDWNTFVDKRNKGDFGVNIFASGGSPAPEILTQSWHSNSIATGSNWTRFKDSEVDLIIDEINRTVDEEPRNRMYKKIQEIIFNEKPIINLYTINQRIMVAKHFQNMKIESVRPNYWLGYN